MTPRFTDAPADPVHHLVNQIDVLNRALFLSIDAAHLAVKSLRNNTAVPFSVNGATITVGTGASAVTTLSIAGGTYITPLLSIQGTQPIVIGKTGYESAFDG